MTPPLVETVLPPFEEIMWRPKVAAPLAMSGVGWVWVGGSVGLQSFRHLPHAPYPLVPCPGLTTMWTQMMWLWSILMRWLWGAISSLNTSERSNEVTEKSWSFTIQWSLLIWTAWVEWWKWKPQWRVFKRSGGEVAMINSFPCAKMRYAPSHSEAIVHSISLPGVSFLLTMLLPTHHWSLLAHSHAWCVTLTSCPQKGFPDHPTLTASKRSSCHNFLSHFIIL